MNRKAFVAGTLIVATILLVGAAIGVPSVLGSTSNLTTLSAEDISAYRWQAMADSYSRLQSVDLTTLRADDISAYRWGAMAGYYSKLQTADLTTLSSEEVTDYRWNALVDYYSTHGLIRYRSVPPGR
jgi:type II secretory pathway pseudopilin PulG